MDRSGAMPRSAWVEIRDERGELLERIPAKISGGSVSAELPAFPAGTRGTVELITDRDQGLEREPPDVRELPTDQALFVVHMG